MRKYLAMIYAFVALSVLGASTVHAADYTGADGVKTTIDNPQRILVLNASNVEILYRLGQQSRIVGVDISAQFPPEVKQLPNVGHPYLPNVEGIISLKPDLVLTSQENLAPERASQLRSADIPVLVLEDSGKHGVEGLKRRIVVIAKLTDTKAQGEALIKETDAALAVLKEKVAARENHKPAIFFLYAHGPGESFISGRDTGAHTLIELVGGTNAADFTTGRKPLTAEAMVQAAPEAIIMLHRGLDAVGGVEGALKLPGVALTPAGKNRRIIAVDDSIRWVSPRFPHFAEALLDAIGP